MGILIRNLVRSQSLLIARYDLMNRYAGTVDSNATTTDVGGPAQQRVNCSAHVELILIDAAASLPISGQTHGAFGARCALEKQFACASTVLLALESRWGQGCDAGNGGTRVVFKRARIIQPSIYIILYI